MTLSTNRRTFLKGCSAAIAAMSGAKLHSIALADDSTNDEILITVFLRGGCDVLSLIPPIGGYDRGLYEDARRYLAIPTAEALPLGTDPFGLHPAAAALHTLYSDNKLAVIQATGLHEDTRSHFDAMSFMELGTPGTKSTTSGWMTRHLQTAEALPESILIPVVSTGTAIPQSLQNSGDAVAIRSIGEFSWYGPWLWSDVQRATIRRLYSSNDLLGSVGNRALDTLDIMEAYVSDEYTPENGAVYPNHTFGTQMQTLAQLIKSGVGVRMATVDLGGWDTHDAQGSGSTGYFATLVGYLSEGLAAFYDDLNSSQSDAPINKVTVVVMSEFGRRLRENADNGTDHGHGGAMLVMGGNVNGGLYGNWPGLRTEQLYDNVDLAVTTDYRQVLSEILIRRHCNPNLGSIFPNYSGYVPLGIVQGDDLLPNYDDSLESAPLSVGMNRAKAHSSRKSAAIAGAGVAMTAGLLALRTRESH